MWDYYNIRNGALLTVQMMRLGFAIYSTRLESSDGDVIHNLLHFLQVVLQ